MNTPKTDEEAGHEVTAGCPTCGHKPLFSGPSLGVYELDNETGNLKKVSSPKPRPDESAQAGRFTTRGRHILITPETCSCGGKNERCNVCCGGLAICSLCG